MRNSPCNLCHNVCLMLVACTLLKSQVLSSADLWHLEDDSSQGTRKSISFSTIRKLLAGVFNESQDQDHVHIVTSKSFVIDESIQAIFPISDMDLTVTKDSLANNSVKVLLENIALGNCVWNFAGVSLEIANSTLSKTKIEVKTNSSNGSDNVSVHAKNSELGKMRLDNLNNSTLINCTHQGNTITSGPLLSWIGCNVAMMNSIFADNTIETNSLIVIADRSQLQIEGCNFTNNMVTNGTISVLNESTITIDRSEFKNNSASNSGGALYLNNHSEVLITSSFFINNTASKGGGGLYFESYVSVNISAETVFESNDGGVGMGGALCGFNSSLHIENSSFLANSASNAGAISANNNCTVILDGVDFKENTARKSNGAVQCYTYCSLHVKNSSFIGHRALDGGAIASITYSNIIIEDCKFEDNRATLQSTGAFVFATHSNSYITRSNFTGNSAGEYGGVILGMTHCNLNIHDCTFLNNIAHRLAGVIYGEKHFYVTVTNSIFKNNTAMGSGGVFSGSQGNAHVHISNCQFENNTAVYGMGGVLTGYKQIQVFNSSFTDNKAGYRGGVFSKPRINTDTSITAENSEFINNYAARSGGVVFSHAIDLNFKNCTFKKNNANLYAGAIYVSYKSNLTVLNGSFEENTAPYGIGGAISVFDAGLIDFKSTIFKNNSALTDGGAITARDTDFMYMTDVQFLNNKAGSSAGALKIGGELSVSAIRMSCIGNSALIYGGCIKMQENSSVCLTDSTVEKNYAGMRGGGIFNKKGLLKLARSNFIDNDAIEGKAIFSFTNVIDDVQSKINTLETNFTSESITLNSASKKFIEKATKCGLIKQDPDPNIDISETKFASVSPVRCMDGCSCYHDISLKKNTYNCNRLNLTAIPTNATERSEIILLQDNRIRWLSAPAYLINASAVNIRGNELTDLNIDVLKVMPNLKKLDVSLNKLKQLPKSLKYIWYQELKIGHNSYHCDCDMLWMRDWLLELSTNATGNYVVDYKTAVCRSGKMVGTPVYRLDEVEMGCHIHQIITIVVSTTVPVLLLTIVLILVAKNLDAIRFFIFLKFNYLSGQDEDTEILADMDFDVFISHSNLDFRWVRDHLVKVLEEVGHYDVCIHEKDFVAGSPILSNITTAIDCSRRIILVLSRNFLNSGWCMEEFRLAHSRLKDGRSRFIVPILLDDFSTDSIDPDLELYIKTYTYIKFTKNLDLFRKKVIYALPRMPLKEYLLSTIGKGELRGLLGEAIDRRMKERYAQITDTQSLPHESPAKAVSTLTISSFL